MTSFFFVGSLVLIVTPQIFKYHPFLGQDCYFHIHLQGANNDDISKALV
jgi:hypothetical protein